MEDEDGPVTPFWLRSSSKTLRQGDRSRGRGRGGRTSSIFLNSTFFVILLLVIALLFMVIIIPSFLKLTSQIFKPQLVKKSWDSLNLVLVLFAIVCAFLGRATNDGSGGDASSDEDRRNVVVSSSSRNQNQWYEYADHRTGNNNSFSRLRSSISYPDLRQESPWTAGDGDGGYRFYDDTHLINHRVSDTDYLHHRRRENREFEVEDSGTKNIHVDTFVSRPKETPPAPPPALSPLSPPPAPPPTTVKRKSKRTYQTLAHEELAEKPVKSELELEKSQPPPLAAPPPPPPPPPPPKPLSPPSDKKNGKSDRKRGGATKDLLTLIYQQKRKKKQRQRSVENFDNILHPPPSPPEPPPPPPQPSAFQNLFSSKKNKTKKIQSAAPPPPPPPPLSKNKTQIALAQSQTTPITTRKPPLPVKTSRFETLDDTTSSGSDSPLLPIPPPPPLPPFKMADWKFVVQGDYVRIKSNGSSGSDSPDMDDVGPSSSNESNQSTNAMDTTDGGDSPPPQPPMFCSSPDVNTKADNFIARFRAGLKLEKMNSIKGIGLSNLGPEPSPSPDSNS